MKANPKTGIERTCEGCGATFFTYPSRVAQGIAKTCSYACTGVVMARRAQLRTADRFWANVDKDGPVPEHRSELGPCWIWRGRIGSDGYGDFFQGSKIDNSRRSVGAHRYSWVLHFAQIPDGLWVLHRCDNRSCIRPSHLFLGTAANNTADMMAKGRGGGGGKPLLTACQNGHPRTSANTLIDGNGHRNCLVCRAAKVARNTVAQRLRRQQRRQAAWLQWER